MKSLAVREYEVHAPETGRVIGRLEYSTAKEWDNIFATAKMARRALAAKADRRRTLEQVLKLFEMHTDHWAALESEACGKPLEHARFEVQLAKESFAYYLKVLHDPSVLTKYPAEGSCVKYVPLGTELAILPANYPFLMAAWKSAVAIAAGNPLVLKPSPTNPLSVLDFCSKLANRTEPGVLSVSLPSNEILLQHLSNDHGPQLISFTGSRLAGKAVSAAASSRKLNLELGGGGYAVVLPDADLNACVTKLFQMANYNAGEDCTSPKRIFVHEGLVADFCSLYGENLRNSRLLPLSSPDAQFGYFKSGGTALKFSNFIDQARKVGEVSQAAFDSDKEGFLAPPAMLLGLEFLNIDTPVLESFPVAHVIPFHDWSEVVPRILSFSGKLATSIWTTDPNQAMELADSLPVGNIWFNDHARHAPEIVHGGPFESGFGSSLGLESLYYHSQYKGIYL